MIIAHKIRIYPNKEQEVFLKKSCGVSRFAYNWGLVEWKNQYKSGRKPNHFIIKKQFNEIKKQEFPFVCEVSKCCTETAFTNLGKAYKTSSANEQNIRNLRRKEYTIRLV